MQLNLLLGQVEGLEAEAALGVMAAAAGVDIMEAVEEVVVVVAAAAGVDIMEAAEVVLAVLPGLVEAEEEAVQVG